MKKIILIMALIVLPLAAFADFQIGATALLNVPLTENQSAGDFTVNDLLFGADARLSLGILEIQGTALYQPGDLDLLLYPMLGIFTDIGVTFKISMIRLSAGIGPNFGFVLDGDDPDPFKLGANVKLSGGIALGDISILLNWMMMIPDLTVDDVAAAFEEPVGYLGLSVLFKLF